MGAGMSIHQFGGSILSMQGMEAVSLQAALACPATASRQEETIRMAALRACQIRGTGDLQENGATPRDGS
jgi:hypothetical protein